MVPENHNVKIEVSAVGLKALCDKRGLTQRARP
jgi:hypothetical protein